MSDEMRIVFLGDMCIDTSFSRQEDTSDPLFATADLVIANLEGAIASAPLNPAIYNAPEILLLLKQFHVQAVTLANNHIFDLPVPLEQTLSHLKSAKIHGFGAGKNITEANEPFIVTNEDNSVAKIFAFGWDVIGCQYLSVHNEGVNPLIPSHVLLVIKELRRHDQDSCVVFVFHWNYELEMFPQPAHRQLAHDLIDAGVDVVVGLHPHVAQGTEIYQGKPIVYSLGNWFFPERWLGSFKLSFPPIAARQLALELVVSGRQVTPKFYWYQFDQRKNTLAFEDCENIDGTIIKELTPFSGLSHKAYIRWFHTHRKRRRGLPIYRDYRNSFENWFKDKYVGLRQSIISSLVRSGIKQGSTDKNRGELFVSRFAVEDYLHPFKNLYRTSPRWVKSSIGWAYSKVPLYIRYGSELTNATNLLAQSQWWDVDTLQSYQWEQMQQLLHHAYNHVPYYRRIWQNAGVAPEDIRNLDDVANLPLLTKGDVRDHKEELVAENYRDRLLPFNSGGSTGTPLEFYWERGRTRSLERAFMWRQWSWANFEYGERTAILRGQTIKEGVHYDPVDNALFLSGFNLSDARAVEYLQALRAFKPASIQAYPATITLLANYMKRASEPPIAGLKVLLCGSENLYPAQRQLLENVFQCRVYSWYGHGESVCLAGGCEESNQYHVYGEYGYIELIDKSNQVMDWIPGTRGEIVGTGFNNWAMPLIRYRSADIAIIGAEKCSCGRPYPLWERIEGRKQEYIIAKDGKLIALTSFIFGQHYHAFDKIKRMQLIQDRPGEILVRLIVVDAWSNEDQAEFRNQMIQALDDHSWQIDYEYVNDIPLTARGKHRFVIQNIPLAGMWDGERY